MSDHLSLSVYVTTNAGDDIHDFNGILVDDIQPLINLIRHNGFETENDRYRFLRTQFWGDALYVIVEAE